MPRQVGHRDMEKMHRGHIGTLAQDTCEHTQGQTTAGVQKPTLRTVPSITHMLQHYTQTRIKSPVLHIHPSITHIPISHILALYAHIH